LTTVISQTTRTTVLPSSHKTTRNNTIQTTKSIIKNSTIATTGLTSRLTTITPITNFTKNTILTTNPDVNITTPATQTSQSDCSTSEGIPIEVKVTIAILAFIAFAGICFSIHYALKLKLIIISDLLPLKPKTTEIAIREQGISISEKY